MEYIVLASNRICDSDRNECDQKLFWFGIPDPILV